MRILIIGAGFVGLSLVRSLQERGYQVRVIEKADRQRQAEGAGICLPASAVARMADLGLKEALLQRAHRVREIHFCRHNGLQLAQASLLEPPLAAEPFLALMRSELMAIFLAETNQQIEYHTWVESFDDRGEVVNVVDNHGQQQEFDLVVGADGIFSPTRKALFTEAGLLNFGLQTWRFVSYQRQHRLQPTYLVGANDLFLLYPISPDSLYCYGHGPLKNTSLSAKEQLQRQFRNYHQPVQQLIAAVKEEDVISGQTLAVKSREVYRGRVLLIGDALHGCPPSMQAGLDLGLQDVVCLRHCLDKEPVPQALATFKQQRLAHISWVIEESNKMIKLAQLGRWWWGRLLRDRIIRRHGPPNVLAWREVQQRGFSLS